MRTRSVAAWCIATLGAIGLCIAIGRADSGSSASVSAASAETRAPVTVGPIAMTVSDLDASSAWYRDTLDFTAGPERTLEGEAFEHLVGVFGAKARVATLTLGSESIELWEFLTPHGRAFPADSRANDAWFQHIAIIVRDMEEATARLTTRRVRAASIGPQTLPAWNTNAAGIRAFYFRDPDGHYLEVLEFPDGKGQARWQSDDRLFLGIDHTAIVVADTDASVRFYSEVLGMRVVGGSENYGPEQERLNAVFGAHLRITTLRGDAGPAIEFLDYLTPHDGRPTPLDSNPTDVWHWHATVLGPAPEDMIREARSNGGWAVSAEPQRFEAEDSTTAREAELVCDPDGHSVLVVGARSSSH